jgi:hypothetical protein
MGMMGGWAVLMLPRRGEGRRGGGLMNEGQRSEGDETGGREGRAGGRGTRGGRRTGHVSAFTAYQRPSDGDSLLLTPGQLRPPLPNVGVVAEIETGDELGG